MQTELIFATLASAATFLKQPVQDVASQSIKDLYQAAKNYVKEKLAIRPDASAALEKLEEKPESEARKALVIEEAEPAKLDKDRQLAKLITQLAEGLKKANVEVKQKVTVIGHRNKVVVAGRDLIQTEKVVRKNEITPDERHITGDQATRLRELNAELAEYLANETGKPNFAAGFQILTKEFGVSSYLLIPRDRFADAVSLLQQRRAMNRGKLRSRNPAAYKQDFYRGIWTRAKELGWEKPQVYQFAFEKLALKKPISSLKALGPNQVKSLGEFMQRAAKKSQS